MPSPLDAPLPAPSPGNLKIGHDIYNRTFGREKTSHTPLWKRQARAKKVNAAADDFSDLTANAQNILNRIALFAGDADNATTVEKLKQHAMNRGVDLDKFTDENGVLQGDAQAAIRKLAMSGNPAYAKMAARLGAYYQIDKATNAARTRSEEEVAAGWTGAEDQFRSALGQPYDPNSGAALAVAANYTAGRKNALFSALNDIDQNAATAKANLDVSTLGSIGDTLATLDALKEQQRMSRIQMGIGAAGAVGTIVAGAGSLLDSGAQAPAARTAPAAAPAASPLDEPWGPDLWGKSPYDNTVRL